MLADTPTRRETKSQSRSGRRPRRAARTPGDRLVTALKALGDGHARIVIHTESPWASVTFAGSRHRLRVAFIGQDAVGAGETFVAELPDHEFAIPGQLVAEARIIAADHELLPNPALRVDLEVLMLEES